MTIFKKDKKKILDQNMVEKKRYYKKRKLQKKAIEKGKLSKKDKLAIVRYYMIENPCVKRYGYNKGIITLFKKKYKIVITDDAVSRLKAEVDEELLKENDIKEGRTKILEMFKNLYEEAERINDKRLILVEIAKIEKLYEEQFKITGSIAGITKEELEGMKDEAIKLLNKDKKQ